MSRPENVETLVSRASVALFNLRIACRAAGLPDDAHAVDLLMVSLVERFPMPEPQGVEL